MWKEKVGYKKHAYICAKIVLVEMAKWKNLYPLWRQECMSLHWSQVTDKKI